MITIYEWLWQTQDGQRHSSVSVFQDPFLHWSCTDRQLLGYLAYECSSLFAASGTIAQRDVSKALLSGYACYQLPITLSNIGYLCYPKPCNLKATSSMAKPRRLARHTERQLERPCHRVAAHCSKDEA
jgi:hypothetical protein